MSLGWPLGGKSNPSPHATSPLSTPHEWQTTCLTPLIDFTRCLALCNRSQSKWWNFFTCRIAVLVPEVITLFSSSSLEPFKTVSPSDFPHTPMKDITKPLPQELQMRKMVWFQAAIALDGFSYLVWGWDRRLSFPSESNAVNTDPVRRLCWSN